MSQIAEDKSVDITSDTVDLLPEADRLAPRSLDVSPAARTLRKRSHESLMRGLLIGAGLGLLLIPGAYLSGLIGESVSHALIVAPKMAEFSQPTIEFAVAEAISVAEEAAPTVGERNSN
jgi:hypothetical protein